MQASVFLLVLLVLLGLTTASQTDHRTKQTHEKQRPDVSYYGPTDRPHHNHEPHKENRFKGDDACTCLADIHSTKTGAYNPSKSILYVDSIKQNIPGAGVEIEGVSFRGGLCTLPSLTLGTLRSTGNAANINNIQVNRFTGVTLAQGTIQAPTMNITQTVQALTGKFARVSNNGSPVKVVGWMSVFDTLNLGSLQPATISGSTNAMITDRVIVDTAKATVARVSYIESAGGRIEVPSASMVTLHTDTVVGDNSESIVNVNSRIVVPDGVCLGGPTVCSTANSMPTFNVRAVTLTSTGVFQGYTMTATVVTIGRTVTLTWPQLIFTSSCANTAYATFYALPPGIPVPNVASAYPIAVRPNTDVVNGYVYLDTNAQLVFAPGNYMLGVPIAVSSWTCSNVGTIGLMGGSITYAF